MDLFEHEVGIAAFFGDLDRAVVPFLIPCDGRSVTHRELLRAIQEDKLRWFLVHRDIMLARQILKQFRFDDDGRQKNLDFKRTPVLDDIRVLDMYDDAVGRDIAYEHRSGNWAQPYSTDQEALLFIRTQLEDPARVRSILDGQRASGRADD